MNHSRLKQIVVFMLASLLSQPAAYSAQLELYTDDVITDFTLTDINNQVHHLTDYRDNVVLVNFWASWCTPCLLEMPSMKRLEQALADQDFVILTLNISDNPRRIRETLKRLKIDLTVLLDHDSKTLNAWQGRMIPTSYLLVRNGDVRYRAVGDVKWDDEEIMLLINRLIQHP